MLFGGTNASGGTGPGMNKSFSAKKSLDVVGDGQLGARCTFRVWQEYGGGGTPTNTNNRWRGDLFLNDWSGSVVFQ